MNEYLYVLKPTRLAMVTDGPTEREQAIVAEHFTPLTRLTEADVMILVGRTQNADESTMGLAIFRAEDDEAAREIMNSDPAVSKGVMPATLFPYRVALMETQSQRNRLSKWLGRKNRTFSTPEQYLFRPIRISPRTHYGEQNSHLQTRR